MIIKILSRKQAVIKYNVSMIKHGLGLICKRMILLNYRDNWSSMRNIWSTFSMRKIWSSMWSCIYCKVEEQFSGLLKMYPGLTNILQGMRTVFWFTEAVSRFD